MFSKAGLYPFESNTIITNPQEGFILGNGDFAAVVTVSSHEVLVMFGKNDIWDSRLDNDSKEQMLRHDDLLRYQKAYGFEWPEDCSKLPQTYAEWDGRPEGLDIIYESEAIQKDIDNCVFFDWGGAGPKKAGQLRILHPGISNTKVNTKLNIENGLLTIKYDFMKGSILIDLFISKTENVMSMRVKTIGIISWVKMFMEKLPDYTDPKMPLPVVDLKNNYFASVSQTVPEGCGTDEFSWTLTGEFPISSSEFKVKPLLPMSYAVFQTLSPVEEKDYEFTFGIKTSRDRIVASVKEDACKLVSNNSLISFSDRLEAQNKAWEKFWGLSEVELEDKELESVWYRSMYGFACHIGQNAQAPGLVANIPLSDYSAFHGYYTWNHNVQKWFVPACSTNHLEWFGSFTALMKQSVPTFRFFAKEIFGLDGLYCDLSTIPHVPPENANVNNKWGRALCIIGWLSHMLWQYWAYTGDRSWLENEAYQFIKETAEFYSNYIDKYMDNGKIYPSMRLEEPGWCPDFVGNENVSTDLCMFRNTFMDAISAANALSKDSVSVDKWQEQLKKVPPIEYGWTMDGQGWYALCSDWDKVNSVISGRRLNDFADINWRIDYARNARWGGGGWPVFPGEYINGDEEGGIAEAIRDMLRRVDLINPPNTICKIHAISCLLPSIRLGLKEKYEDIRTLLLTHRYSSGQHSSFSVGEGELSRGFESWRIQENQFQGIECIVEMLLQSQGGVIKIFPFLPDGKSAGFTNLRAIGGFIVSAKRNGDTVKELKIESTIGGIFRINWQFLKRPIIKCGNEKIEYKVENNILSFETLRDASYTFKL